MIKTIVFIIGILLSLVVYSSDTTQRITPEEYIKIYNHIALHNMEVYGIPASITLAQGILESGFGNSELAVNANNHFGIKCHVGWTGDSYLKDDDEENECFRKYDNAEASYKDHALFLTTRSRYLFLFEFDITDYKGWANGLLRAGYATNPAYANRLINIIERYSLYEFDNPEKLAKRENKDKQKEISEKQEQKREGVTERRSDDTDRPMLIIGKSRNIKTHNGIKHIIVQPGDNLYTIADELDIRPWLLRNYNDFESGDIDLKPGDIIYLQSKKRRGSADTHTVEDGESMHYISQKYGIRLRNLYRYNNINENEEPKPGTVLKLRRRIR